MLHKVEIKQESGFATQIKVGDHTIIGSGQDGEITQFDLNDLHLILQPTNNKELRYMGDNIYVDDMGWMYTQVEKNGPLYVVKAGSPLTRKQKIVKFLKKLWRW